MHGRVSRALVALGVVAACAAAQQSRCADCHFANLVPSFARHLRDWDLSVHSFQKSRHFSLLTTETARGRLGALLEELANPSGR